MFYMADNHDYLPLRDYVVPAGGVVKGELIHRQNCYCFVHNDADEDDEVVIVAKCERVRADKATGTGNAIISGDKLYWNAATDTVSPTNGGADIFVGWAVENAGTAEEDVLMNFDGRLNEDVV